MEKEGQTRPHETKLSRVVGSAERPGRKARSSKEDEWEGEARKARAVPTRKSAAKGSANVLCGARVGHGDDTICRVSVVCRDSARLTGGKGDENEEGIVKLVQRTRTSDLLEARRARFRDPEPRELIEVPESGTCRTRGKGGRVSDETVEPAVGLTREREGNERGESGAACSKGNQWPSRVEEEEVRREVSPKKVALTQLALVHAISRRAKARR